MTDPTDAATPNVLPGLARDTLRDYLAERLEITATLTLRSVRLAGQGMSDDTILVEAQQATGQPHSVVIRRYRRDGVLRRLVDPLRHYQTLKVLEPTAIPAPRALWFDPDGAPLGGPCFGMERLAGSVPIPWSPSGRKFLAAAGAGPLGERFVSLLAEIHALDWSALGLEGPAEASDQATTLLDTLELMFQEYREGPEPILVDALGWLRANRPRTNDTVLVHGDYRTGNLLFTDHAITGVLDWEFAQPGDPMQDLAWVLAASNRVGSDLACYLMAPDRFVELYQRYSGRTASWPTIRFWQVYYQVFNAVGWLQAQHKVRSGATTDLRMLRWSYTLPTMRRLVLDALREAT